MDEKLTPQDAMYDGPRERYGPDDRAVIREGKEEVTYQGDELREAVGIRFFQVLQAAMHADPDFGPDADVSDYNRLTVPGCAVEKHPASSRERHFGESAREARADLHELGCPAKPFSLAASGVLMERGTDPSVPSDLSSLPPDDGTAVG